MLARAIAAVAGVLGLGGLAALARRRALGTAGAAGTAAPGGDAVTSPIKDAVKVIAGNKVLNRELAARDGVRPQMLWLLDEWERVGTHVVRIREKSASFPSGAVRWTEEEQAGAAAKGLSGAKDLNSTAHGPKWRAALDVEPFGFNGHRSFAQQPPEMFEQVKAFAFWAEQQVHPDGTRFRSGRLFTNIVAPDGVVGDWGHIEIVGWAKLPALSEERR